MTVKAMQTTNYENIVHYSFQYEQVPKTHTRTLSGIDASLSKSIYNSAGIHDFLTVTTVLILYQSSS